MMIHLWENSLAKYLGCLGFAGEWRLLAWARHSGATVIDLPNAVRTSRSFALAALSAHAEAEVGEQSRQKQVYRGAVSRNTFAGFVDVFSGVGHLIFLSGR